MCVGVSMNVYVFVTLFVCLWETVYMYKQYVHFVYVSMYACDGHVCDCVCV